MVTTMETKSILKNIWDELVKRNELDLLMWLATRNGVLSDYEMRMLACKFVKETPLLDGGTTFDLLDGTCKKTVELSESYAENLITNKALAIARNDTGKVATRLIIDNRQYYLFEASFAAYSAAEEDAYRAIYGAQTYSLRAACRAFSNRGMEIAKEAHVKILAHRFGNPFEKQTIDFSQLLQDSMINSLNQLIGKGK